MTEAHYRIAFLLIIVATMSVVLWHRRLAAASGERISRRDEGLWVAILLRLAGFGLWISAVLWLTKPSFVDWAAIGIPVWGRFTGVVLGIFSPVLMYWTLSSLGRNLTDTVIVRKSAELVTIGPYRWVRHPYYVTAALLMASATLLTSNLVIGVCSVMVLALLALRTPREEQRLLERFGEPYRQYRQRTGKFLPRFRSRFR